MAVPLLTPDWLQIPGFPGADPLAGVLGGALIGLAASFTLLGLGRVAGVSGIAARAFGLSRPFGLLTSGAVAICGASAALAISSVLPKGANHERDTVFTIGKSNTSERVYSRSAKHAIEVAK